MNKLKATIAEFRAFPNLVGVGALGMMVPEDQLSFASEARIAEIERRILRIEAALGCVGIELD